ncbi:hypothetical protein DFH06DRAFT_1127583 [Mycena polygramma]|nr:hypothetical protein DFH06DRAFT_1127583 [Mycena polygramma]
MATSATSTYVSQSAYLLGNMGELQNRLMDTKTYVSATLATESVASAPAEQYLNEHTTDTEGQSTAPEILTEPSEAHDLRLPTCFHNIEAAISSTNTNSGKEISVVTATCSKSEWKDKCAFHVDLYRVMSTEDLVAFKGSKPKTKQQGTDQVGCETSTQSELANSAEYVTVEAQDRGAKSSVGWFADHLTMKSKTDTAEADTQSKDVTLDQEPSLVEMTDVTNDGLLDISTDAEDSDDDIPALETPSDYSGSFEYCAMAAEATADEEPVAAETHRAFTKATEALKRLTDSVTEQMRQFVLTHPSVDAPIPNGREAPTLSERGTNARNATPPPSPFDNDPFAGNSTMKTDSSSATRCGENPENLSLGPKTQSLKAISPKSTQLPTRQTSAGKQVTWYKGIPGNTAATGALELGTPSEEHDVHLAADIIETRSRRFNFETAIQRISQARAYNQVLGLREKSEENATCKDPDSGMIWTRKFGDLGYCEVLAWFVDVYIIGSRSPSTDKYKYNERYKQIGAPALRRLHEKGAGHHIDPGMSTTPRLDRPPNGNDAASAVRTFSDAKRRTWNATSSTHNVLSANWEEAWSLPTQASGGSQESCPPSPCTSISEDESEAEAEAEQIEDSTSDDGNSTSAEFDTQELPSGDGGGDTDDNIGTDGGEEAETDDDMAMELDSVCSNQNSRETTRSPSLFNVEIGSQKIEARHSYTQRTSSSTEKSSPYGRVLPIASPIARDLTKTRRLSAVSDWGTAGSSGSVTMAPRKRGHRTQTTREYGVHDTDSGASGPRLGKQRATLGRLWQPWVGDSTDTKKGTDRRRRRQALIFPQLEEMDRDLSNLFKVRVADQNIRK